MHRWVLLASLSPEGLSSRVVYMNGVLVSTPPDELVRQSVIKRSFQSSAETCDEFLRELKDYHVAGLLLVDGRVVAVRGLTFTVYREATACQSSSSKAVMGQEKVP